MKKVKYKVSIYDSKIGYTYPIYVVRDDFFDLCKWINGYLKIYKVNIMGAQAHDLKGNVIGDVKFLDIELRTQYFFESCTVRLLSFNMQKQKEEGYAI